MGYLLGKIKAVLMGNFSGTDTKVAVDTDGHLQVDVLTIDLGDHASRHTDPTEDLIDGDQLDIDFTPTNYTPDATPGVADDVDDLSAHLYGLDVALLTMPTRPCFYVTLGTVDTNFTINTEHTTEMDTEVFDQGSDFNTGTFTFTAPVDGRYLLSASWRFGSTLDATAQFYQVRIVTSNRHHVTLLAPKWSSDPNYHTVHSVVVCDMDANDTAHMQHYQQGGAAQTNVDINETRFSGVKVA